MKYSKSTKKLGAKGKYANKTAKTIANVTSQILIFLEGVILRPTRHAKSSVTFFAIGCYFFRNSLMFFGVGAHVAPPLLPPVGPHFRKWLQCMPTGPISGSNSLFNCRRNAPSSTYSSYSKPFEELFDRCQREFPMRETFSCL